MLDEQDIEMLARLMSQQKEDIISEVGVVVDSKIKDSEQRMITTMDSKVRESERRMMVMMESYFDPKFQALSERLDDIEKKLIPQEAMDIMEDRVDDLEKTVAIHTRQIEELKKLSNECLRRCLFRVPSYYFRTWMLESASLLLAPSS